MALVRYIVILSLLPASLVGCSGAQRLLGREDSAKNKGASDTGKPSDEDEGVPGYLTDPDMISALERAREGQSSEIVLVGRSGAVKTTGASIDDLVVIAWVVARSEFDGWSDGSRVTVPGTAVGRGQPNGEGGFRLKLTNERAKGILVIALARVGRESELVVEKRDVGFSAAYLNTKTHQFVGLVPGATVQADDGELTIDKLPENLAAAASTLGGDVPEAARGLVTECLTSMFGAVWPDPRPAYYLEARSGKEAIDKDHHVKVLSDAPARLVHIRLESTERISGVTLSFEQRDSIYCLEVDAPQFDHITITRSCGVRVYESLDVEKVEKIQRQEKCD